MAESGLMEDLYREIILDHYRQPRNRGVAIEPTCSAEGANPLCGDQVRIDVLLADGVIDAISFGGQGCSISQASASMMTEYAKGRTAAAALAGVEAFQQMMLTGDPPDIEGFDDIAALAGVARFPARVKCASLAWKTLAQAVAEGGGTVTTDDGSR